MCAPRYVPVTLETRLELPSPCTGPPPSKRCMCRHKLPQCHALFHAGSHGKSVTPLTGRGRGQTQSRGRGQLRTPLEVPCCACCVRSGRQASEPPKRRAMTHKHQRRRRRQPPTLLMGLVTGLWSAPRHDKWRGGATLLTAGIRLRTSVIAAAHTAVKSYRSARTAARPGP